MSEWYHITTQIEDGTTWSSGSVIPNWEAVLEWIKHSDVSYGSPLHSVTITRHRDMTLEEAETL